MSVAAIVLAAGRSTRMGGPNKLLADLDGKPLVRHVVEAALASAARPVLVVTGHESARIEDGLTRIDRLSFVHNPHFADGLSTSLRTALAALPGGAMGAVILLGDMPRVTAALVDRLVAVFAASPQAAAIVPVHGGLRGNPVLLARRIFGDVARLTGDQGARAMLADRPDVVEIEIDDPAVALDIDTPEALSRLRGR